MKRLKILVAYDGSACADAALDDLVKAGLPSDAEALVVSVAESWSPTLSSYEVVSGTLLGSGLRVKASKASEQADPALKAAQELDSIELDVRPNGEVWAIGRKAGGDEQSAA